MMDTRIARWWSNDPVFHENMSPYNLIDNSPVQFLDPTGSDSDWIPKIKTTENEETGETESYLTVLAEVGDNAETLANFLDISASEAESLFDEMRSNNEWNIRVPEHIAEPINNSLKDVANPSGNDYIPHSYIPDAWEENYNCWECAIALSKGNTPDFSRTMEGGEFTRTLLQEYENVSDDPSKYVFGRTAIRFGESTTNVLGITNHYTNHGATYLGTSRDGQIYVWTKDGRIEAPKISTLEDTIERWGPVQGAGTEENEGGFYNYILGLRNPKILKINKNNRYFLSLQEKHCL